jgi:hypothetical protein
MLSVMAGLRLPWRLEGRQNRLPRDGDNSSYSLDDLLGGDAF